MTDPYDNWVITAPACEKCGRERRHGESLGGVYARGRRMAVCLKCYLGLSADPRSYRKQVERYQKKGL